MSTPLPAARSFAETFCAQYGIPPERYAATVLRLTLYPHARWLAGADRLLALDREFIAGVGRLTRWSAFPSEADRFQGRLENQRFLRRSLRLRVSVNRMRILFSEVMGGTSSARTNAANSRTDGDAAPGTFAAD